MNNEFEKNSYFLFILLIVIKCKIPVIHYTVLFLPCSAWSSSPDNTCFTKSLCNLNFSILGAVLAVAVMPGVYCIQLLAAHFYWRGNHNQIHFGLGKTTTLYSIKTTKLYSIKIIAGIIPNCDQWNSRYIQSWKVIIGVQRLLGKVPGDGCGKKGQC